MLCGWGLQMMFLLPLSDHREGKNNKRQKPAGGFQSRIIQQGENHTYRSVSSRNKQRAHQAARANQLWNQDVDQLEIWIEDLQAAIAGANWTRARVRAGGTLDKKSDKRKLSASATMTLRMKERKSITCLCKCSLTVVSSSGMPFSPGSSSSSSSNSLLGSPSSTLLPSLFPSLVPYTHCCAGTLSIFSMWQSMATSTNMNGPFSLAPYTSPATWAQSSMVSLAPTLSQIFCWPVC